MSISTITNLTSGSAQILSPYLQKRDHALSQLDASLSSSDLAGAQTAYAQIQKLTAGVIASGKATPSIVQDLNAIGQALQNSDLSAAQKAFAQLQADHAKFTHHQQGGGSQIPSPSTNSSSTDIAAAATSGATISLLG